MTIFEEFTFNLLVKEIPFKKPGVDGSSLWIDKDSSYTGIRGLQRDVVYLS
jgi:hypothetical protein